MIKNIKGKILLACALLLGAMLSHADEKADRPAQIKILKQIEENIKDQGEFSPLYVRLLLGPFDYATQEGQQQLYNARLVKQKRVESYSEYEYIFHSNEQLIAMLKSTDLRDHSIAAQKVFHTGNNAPKVHEAIAETLRLALTAVENGHNRIDEAAWLSKALAASADDKHRRFVEYAASMGDEKLHFHASHALKLFDAFKASYKALAEACDIYAMSDKEFHKLVLTLPHLSIKDASLHFLLTKKLYQDDPEIGELAYQSFKDEYMFVRRNARQVGPAKRIMQLFALSGDATFLPFLEEVQKKAPSKHVRAYSKAFRAKLKKAVAKNAR